LLRERSARDAKDHGFAAKSTRRQLMRYVSWWTTANGYFPGCESDIAAQAQALAECLPNEGEANPSGQRASRRLAPDHPEGSRRRCSRARSLRSWLHPAAAQRVGKHDRFAQGRLCLIARVLLAGEPCTLDANRWQAAPVPACLQECMRRTHAFLTQRPSPTRR